MICSNTLQQTEVRRIVVGITFVPLFEDRCYTCQSSGNFPVVKRLSKYNSKYSLALTFRILVEMLSGPGALLGSSDSRSFFYTMVMSGIAE